jgi:DNA-binding winged helix-turn-helix (wHTH) protein/tetratricopeptide (TPR) repeat protein
MSGKSLTEQVLIRFGGYELDPSARTLKREGRLVAIKPKTFDLLLYLAEHPHELVTKERLLTAVWPNSFVEERNLSQHVFLLRKALAASGHGDGIVATVPGKGYQFTAELERVPRHAPHGAGEGLVIHSVQSITRVVVEEDEDSGPGTEEGLAEDDGRLAPASQNRHWRWWAAGGIAAALLAIGGWIAWFEWPRLHPRTASHVQVVIADFENSTGDATFDHTLNKVVQIDLQQSPYFTVVSEGRLRHAMALMGRKADAPIGGEDVREACQRLNAQVVLTPAIALIGSRYVVTMSAYNCADGSSIGARREDADAKAGVLRAVEYATSRIRGDVGESRASLKEFDMPLYLERTTSLDALKAYSEGHRQFDSGKFEDAARLFQHAVELDPNFAIAYAQLSTTYYNLGDNRRDKENIAKAYAMRDTVDERERLYITYRYHWSVTGDLHAVLDTLEVWSATYPQDTIAMADLASNLTWIGRYSESAALAAKAVQLDDANGTSNGIIYEMAARAYKRAGMYDEALKYCNAAVQRKIDTAGIHTIALQIAALRHDEQEVARQIAWSRGTADEGAILQDAGMAALADGRVRASERLFDESANAARRDKTEDDLAATAASRPRMLVEMGLAAQAKTLMNSLSALDSSSGQDSFSSQDSYMDGVFTMAEIGDAAKAKAAAERRQKESPQDTLVNVEYVPAVNAALALRAGKPADALEMMRGAEQYEMHDPTVAYLRGQVFLAAGKPLEAETEFRKLIDNPGIDDPLTPLHALAHLNLARELAQEQKTEDARAEYGRFLEMWKTADSDLPPLKQARTEMALLKRK